MLDAARAGPDAVVVGHDWGALVGWALAAAQPHRVGGLVAVSVPHPRAFAAAIATDPDQQARSAYIALFRQQGRAEDALLADGARRLQAVYADAGLAPEQIRAYVEPMRDRAALTAALAWYRALGPTTLADVGPVDVPTTFVWGEQDMAVGAVSAQDCGRHVRADYSFVPLGGVSHWVPDRSPQSVVDAVLRRGAGPTPTTA